MATEPYTPDEAELIGCYAGVMEEQAGENYATAKADAERGIAKIKADAVLAAVGNVLEIADFMASDAETELNAGNERTSEILIQASNDLHHSIEGAIR